MTTAAAPFATDPQPLYGIEIALLQAQITAATNAGRTALAAVLTSELNARVAAGIPDPGAAHDAGLDAVMLRRWSDGSLYRLVVSELRANLFGTRNVKDYGATGDGVTDDTAAIQAALDACAPRGWTLRFPQGTYVVSDIGSPGANGYCLKVTSPIRMVGDGPYSIIAPAAGVSDATNIVMFQPDPGYAADFTLVEGLRFTTSDAVGTRHGNHCLYLNTQAAGAQLAKFTVRDCLIGQGAGRAIFHLNDAGNNVNGGLWAALFEANELKGGIELDVSGDSIVVRNNVISGTGIGVYASLVAGASLLSIVDNNITSLGGSVKIDAGSRFQILRNNCEMPSAGGSNGAMIDVNGANGTMFGGVIASNHLGAFNGAGLSSLIRVRNCNGPAIRDNVLLSADAVAAGIDIATSNDVRVGANTYNAGITAKVADAGAGTIGVTKTLTLTNNWVAYGSGRQAPSFAKDEDGWVTLSGDAKSGDTVQGTTVYATLPVGFRPAAEQLFTVAMFDGGTGYGAAQLFIAADGSIVYLTGGNTRIGFSGIRFRASTNADGTSTE